MRFSLKTLLWVASLMAAFLGGWAPQQVKLNRARAEAERVKAVAHAAMAAEFNARVKSERERIVYQRLLSAAKN